MQAIEMPKLENIIHFSCCELAFDHLLSLGSPRRNLQNFVQWTLALAWLNNKQHFVGFKLQIAYGKLKVFSFSHGVMGLEQEFYVKNEGRPNKIRVFVCFVCSLERFLCSSIINFPHWEETTRNIEFQYANKNATKRRREEEILKILPRERGRNRYR